ncbi:MAG: hypothetical protein U9Q96_01640 [Patescibacteria group bacterium]|nr:hypothetical protein [Patescibacteria group bacterium]
MDEIKRRVDGGTLVLPTTLAILQQVAEGEFEGQKLIHGMFMPIEAQLKMVRQRNTERGWGFTDEDFSSLDGPPAWPEDRLSAVVLIVGLESIQRTFDEAWYFVASVQSRSYRARRLLSHRDNFRLYPGIRQKKGLSWKVIDLGANQQKSSNQVREAIGDVTLLPHSAVLWEASYSPKWIQSMDGKNVPYVDIPGYQLTIPGYQPWADVPYLYWLRDGRQVDMDACYADDINDYWAVPVFRK